jgi:LysR family transcriptional regulator, benzoate and cis,cis-muconate-responsive activator of ben and cat genes
MELRQLRYFVAVAETGNISRAAQKIFLTQPALSRQIKALEEELGQCLLERQAHSVRLTPAGQTLLREARELLRQADMVVERVRTAGHTLRVRIGYAPSLATGLLSTAVEAFTQKHPAAGVEMLDLSTKEMRTDLESGELDLALTVGNQRDTKGVKWTRLVLTPWQLAVHENHRLWRQARVSPAEVARERLLVFCQRDYPEYWEIMAHWLRQHHQLLKVAGEYDGIHSLLAAVESGLGVGLVTARSGRLIPERVRLKELSDGPEPLCIAAGYRTDRGNDKPLAVLVEELRLAANRAG